MKALNPFDVSFAGVNLIEASAGTGKTYNITSLFIRALVELDIPVGKILVVTYTEAATKELKDRLITRMRESLATLKKGMVDDENDQFLHELLEYVGNRKQAVERLEKAIRGFDESAVYTIHGFCYQALQEQAFESRAMYDAELIGDDSELILEAVDDYWRKWVASVVEQPKRQPLLKLLLDKGYQPEKLASELGPHLGKSHLDILPGETLSVGEIQSRLDKLKIIFEEMLESWSGSQKDILELLLSDGLNGRKYRKDYLANWFGYMEEFLESDFLDIIPFKQFSNFAMSTLEDNLNKGCTEAPYHPFFQLTEQYLDLLDSVREIEVTFKKNLFAYLSRELDQKKEELQVLSYDDLLLRLRKALIDPGRGEGLADKLREKYPIAMVDEFQDTDPSQYDIFRQIYADREQSALFMIGDPKQSIYSFRGADVFSYLKAKQDAPPEKTYDLGRNFRSTPELLKGLNTLFGEHENPFILDRISYEGVRPGMDLSAYSRLREYGEVHPPIRFRCLPLGERDQFNKNEAAEWAARDTASEIYRILEDGKGGAITIGKEAVKAKDIAVLVRTHKQASLMADALRSKGIKSVQYSQESVFSSEEAEQLAIFLKAVVEPGSESRVRTALALPLTSFTGRDLFEIEEDEDRWLSVLELFDKWHRMWQEKGFSVMFRSVIKEARIAEFVIQSDDGERRLTNLLHLGELMQAEAKRQKNGMRGLLKWFARKRQEEKVQQDEEQLRLESDRELVKIVTMHRSKGLEYPIVFCPFLWYGPQYQDGGKPLVYHDPEDLQRTYLDLNGKSDPERGHKRLLVAREELAESLRLAYVAMTRAEQVCYLSWAYARSSEFSPLGYLFLEPAFFHELLTETIEKRYDAAGNRRFRDAIEQFCEEYPSLFTRKSPSGLRSGDQQLELLSLDSGSELQPRLFTRPVPLRSSYAVSSFSSLSSWMEAEDPDVHDYDQFIDYPDARSGQKDTPREKSMFTFPKGPQPGTCIHNIFENYYSKSGDRNEVIANQLQFHGIDAGWKKTVSSMLETVLAKHLHPEIGGLSLAAVKDCQIPEMEFYFQNEEIETRELLSIIRGNDLPGWVNRGRAGAGFLKGFIDLTFEFRGKYYLLDYKTNYLGNTVRDYRVDELAHEIREASYDLQYHIYTLALHRYLKKRISGYSYNDHFGGAFYLFVRGINEEGKEGIFFDRPVKEVITKLDQYIRGGDNG